MVIISIFLKHIFFIRLLASEKLLYAWVSTQEATKYKSENA